MATAPSNTEEFKSLLRNHVRGYYTIDPYGNIWQLQINKEKGDWWQNITQVQDRKLGEDGLRYDYERENLIPWYVANADNTFGEGFDWENAPWYLSLIHI